MRRHDCLVWRLADCGVVLLLAAAVVQTPAAAAAVQPDSNLVLSARDGAYIGVTWTPSPVTSGSRVCFAVATPPQTVGTGTGCSEVLVGTATWSFAGTTGTTYGVSVFSYDAAAAEYGPPISGTITATDRPPLAPIALGSESTTAREVVLRWSDNPGNARTKDYLLAWAPGLVTPPVPPSDAAHVSRDGGGIVVSSLQPNRVYTFAVRVRDSAGQIGPPALLRAAGRDAGLWVAGNNNARHVIVPSRLPGFFFFRTDGSALLEPDGTVRAALRWANFDRFFVVARYLRGGWNPGKFGWQNIRHPLVATAPGILVVAYTSRWGVYYLTKVAGRWSTPIRASAVASEEAVGLATDVAHRVHLLVARSSGAAPGLYYLTSSGSAISRSFVAGSAAGDVGLLTRDPARDRLVVVVRHRSALAETLKVKSVASRAVSVGGLVTWLRSTNRLVQWTPTQVAAYGGRITVGVQRATARGSRLADGPYVIDGTSTTHHGLARVAGSGRYDVGLTVSMPSATKAVLSWQRRDAWWNPSRLGVWVSTRYASGSAAVWRFTAPSRWSRSAYDVPLGAFADARGHVYAVYVRDSADVRQ